MAEDLIGKPINRREDKRFLTGKGAYSDDLNKTVSIMPSSFAVRSHMLKLFQSI